jgi:hypothetical protein
MDPSASWINVRAATAVLLFTRIQIDIKPTAVNAPRIRAPDAPRKANCDIPDLQHYGFQDASIKLTVG